MLRCSAKEFQPPAQKSWGRVSFSWAEVLSSSCPAALPPSSRRRPHSGTFPWRVCSWVKQTFEEADKNGDGLLNIEEIHQLMHKLNVNLPRRKVRQMFQVGASSTGFHCADSASCGLLLYRTTTGSESWDLKPCPFQHLRLFPRSCLIQFINFTL